MTENFSESTSKIPREAGEEIESIWQNRNFIKETLQSENVELLESQLWLLLNITMGTWKM